MGVLSDLARGGVDRLERSLGKRAALRTLAGLIDTLPEGPARAEALVRAIELAAELGEPTFEGLATRWSMERAGRHADARAALRRVMAAGRMDAAAFLAEQERIRTQGSYDEPSAWYAGGRAEEARGRLGDAIDRYDRAAQASGQPRLRRLSRVRAIRALHRAGRRDEAAQRAAALLPLEEGAPWERLVVGVAALDAPGRYRRAAGLDALETVAQGGGALGARACAYAARHALSAGAALSDIEVDRVEAVLAHVADPEARATVIERVRAAVRLSARAPGAASAAAHGDEDAEDVLRRARAVLNGAPPGPRPEGARRELAWLGLEAIHAATHGHGSSVRGALEQASERVRAGQRVEAVLWTAILACLPSSPERAAELARACLAGRGDPPPRGYGSIATALEAAGVTELAIETLRLAARLREDGARARLAAHLVHRGWTAAAEGRRDDAIALLREARLLAG